MPPEPCGSGGACRRPPPPSRCPSPAAGAPPAGGRGPALPAASRGWGPRGSLAVFSKLRCVKHALTLTVVRTSLADPFPGCVESFPERSRRPPRTRHLRFIFMRLKSDGKRWGCWPGRGGRREQDRGPAPPPRRAGQAPPWVPRGERARRLRLRGPPPQQPGAEPAGELRVLPSAAAFPSAGGFSYRSGSGFLPK